MPNVIQRTFLYVSGISVTLALLFIKHFEAALSFPCDLTRERLSLMRLLPNNSLTAAKLYDTTFTSIVKCSSHCTSEEICLYMTINRNNYTCTFYSMGKTIYNVTQLQTYKLVEKNVTKVNVFPNSECNLC